ncbi:enoyl-ACP reductase FabV [Saccharicrinis aurantiacus]|uniref:enoyl-ACP reductase FabV n=1 Tax=Saccharicrinis aurantiacus TaxID=1849719 RepID=UPI00083899E0|nr:enoyl-ACP reductase FabV [Saccharicrinis aurantiacus]
MIIEAKTRGFICLTAHPKGCEQNVINQINYVKSKGEIAGPKKVLVIGSSTGFGLASRISSAYGCGASTIGVYFEKDPKPGKPASAGWYNTAAFEKIAQADGLYAKSINGDAFSKEVKQQTIDLIKEDFGKVDMVVYSLASPLRVHPETGVKHRSVLKPIGKPYTNKTVDFHTGEVSEITIEPCSGQEDIDNTVAVMGGEDWEMWIDALKEADVLEEGFLTMAYSYIGPDVTTPIYTNGTIGQAKKHLAETAKVLSTKLEGIKGNAYVSVNKALVTQASSAIPVIPLYVSLLFKVMKEKGIHEGCIEQIQRLYADKMFKNGIDVDEEGFIRVDDWEMREDVQEIVSDLWAKVDTESLKELGDLSMYSDDFYNLFGFKVEGVEYGTDIDEMVQIPGLQ